MDIADLPTLERAPIHTAGSNVWKCLSPAPANTVGQLTSSSWATWQVKTWRPWSTRKMGSREELGLRESHWCPILEGFLPGVLRQLHTHLGRGASEPRPAPPLPSAILEVRVRESDFSSSFLNSVLYGWIKFRALQLRRQSLGHSGTRRQQWAAAVCSCLSWEGEGWRHGCIFRTH